MTAIDGFTSTSKFVEQFKGQFGEELVDVVAAAAGLTTSRMNLDVNGVDRLIEMPGGFTLERPARIQVQVKTTRRATVHSDGAWHYPMRAEHFNQLVGEQYEPRYLLLVPVPREPGDWIKLWSAADELRIACTAVYWANLMPLPRVGGRQTTVHVPVSNVLTPQTIVRLFDYAQIPGVSAR